MVALAMVWWKRDNQSTTAVKHWLFSKMYNKWKTDFNTQAENYKYFIMPPVQRMVQQMHFHDSRTSQGTSTYMGATN